MKHDALQVSGQAEGRWRLHLDRNGEELCRVVLVREILRIGRSWITAGGVAGLYTPPDRRMEGHARELMAASHEFLIQSAPQTPASGFSRSPERRVWRSSAAGYAESSNLTLTLRK